MLAGKGDLLPVSAFPVDGTWPVGTTRWEKRTIATEVPVWDAKICIQCNKCALVCPHAAIRAKVYEPSCLEERPPPSSPSTTRGRTSRTGSTPSRWRPGLHRLQSVRHGLPGQGQEQSRHKSIDMMPLAPVLEKEKVNYAFFLSIPDPPRDRFRSIEVKSSQFLLPLFEYSGACAGCGETPYLKLLSQLLGDRLLMANATGCSSIYGGNLPTTPYTTNRDGRGPAWSNSLFEDAAEFGLGMHLGAENLASQARSLLGHWRRSWATT